MEEALNLIVNKMFTLGFSDDDYRNRSEGSKVVGFQYYIKRSNDSDWEVYATYNPVISMLSLHYHKMGKDEDKANSEYSYPVFFIHINTIDDAYTACKLLEMKTDYLWKNTTTSEIPTNDEMSSTLKKAGCVFRKKENNISRWSYGNKSILIENGVKLSVYMFETLENNNSKPIMAIRNIHEEGSWKEVAKYLKRKIIN